MKPCTQCHETKPLTEFTWSVDKRLTAGGRHKSLCKTCCAIVTKAWYEKNKDRALKAQAAWREANKAQWNLRMSIASNKRRAVKLNAHAGWADNDLIADIYEYAAIMRQHGVEAEVDHIVPLQGELVCGLHTHDNLTVILAEHNRSKRNAFTIL